MQEQIAKTKIHGLAITFWIMDKEWEKEIPFCKGRPVWFQETTWNNGQIVVLI